MQSVDVDAAARTARAGGGTTWGRFNDVTAAHGLATTGGIISTTGIGGLTLGGGIGYLCRGVRPVLRQPGLGRGRDRRRRVVTASEDENPDLFWALRGGGGNFGVVTEFTYRLHPVDHHLRRPDVLRAGRRRRRHRVLPRLHPDGATRVRRLPGLPDRAAAAVRAGEPGRRAVRRARLLLDRPRPRRASGSSTASARSRAPVAEHVGPMPYPALNSAFDALVPPGLQHYWKAAFVNELTDEAIAVHMEHGARCRPSTRRCTSTRSTARCHDVAADATAFGHRDANFAPVIAGMWPDPADNERNIRWVRDYYAAIAPHSEAGGYVNFASADDQPRWPTTTAPTTTGCRGQAALRPRQPVPPQPEHPAGRCALTAGQLVLSRRILLRRLHGSAAGRCGRGQGRRRGDGDGDPPSSARGRVLRRRSRQRARAFSAAGRPTPTRSSSWIPGQPQRPRAPARAARGAMIRGPGGPAPASPGRGTGRAQPGPLRDHEKRDQPGPHRHGPWRRRLDLLGAQRPRSPSRPSSCWSSSPTWSASAPSSCCCSASTTAAATRPRPRAPRPPRPTSLVAVPGRDGRRAAAAARHQPLADGRRASPPATRRRTPCGCRWTPRSSPARSGSSAPSSSGSSPPSSFPDPLVGLRIGVATLLGGMVTAGVTYLLVARAARAVTALALAAHPPAGALTLGVRPRLLLTWGLTSGVPMLGVVLLFLDPSNPDGPGEARGRLPRRRRPARRRRWPPCSPRARSASRCATCGGRCSGSGDGDYDVARRWWTTPARSGCCRRASTRWPPAWPSASGCATCSAGTSGRRSPSGRWPPASRWAARSARSPRCSSTSPAPPRWSGAPGPEEMVGLLNRFFEVVVDDDRGRGRAGEQVRGRRGAVRLRRARPTTTTRPGRRCGRPAGSATPSPAAGEVDVGVGVACGRGVGRSGRGGQPAGVHGDRRPGERGGPAHRARQGPPRPRAWPARPTVRTAERRPSASTGRAAPRSSCAGGASRPSPGCATSRPTGQSAGAPGRRPGSARPLPSGERTTTRTSSGCRVPISGSSKRSVRPPRVTDRTMSRSERGSRPDLAGGHRALVQVQALAAGDEVLDDGDHARGVGREAEQPAGGRRRGDDGVGAGLPEQVGVLLLADTGRDRHARVELPHGERDEDGGVVPVGRDDDRAGALDRGPAQHLGAAGVADDAGAARGSWPRRWPAAPGRRRRSCPAACRWPAASGWRCGPWCRSRTR